MKIANLFSAAAMLALLSTSSAFALATVDEAACKNMSAKMDKNSDGKFDAEESRDMMTKMAEMKLTTADPTMMSNDEFMANCKLGNLGNMDTQSN